MNNVMNFVTLMVLNEEWIYYILSYNTHSENPSAYLLLKAVIFGVGCTSEFFSVFPPPPGIDFMEASRYPESEIPGVRPWNLFRKARVLQDCRTATWKCASSGRFTFCLSVLVCSWQSISEFMFPFILVKYIKHNSRCLLILCPYC